MQETTEAVLPKIPKLEAASCDVQRQHALVNMLWSFDILQSLMERQLEKEYMRTTHIL